MKYNILLVEDDKQIREVIEDYISEKPEDMIVATAADGSTGLSMLHQRSSSFSPCFWQTQTAYILAICYWIWYGERIITEPTAWWIIILKSYASLLEQPVVRLKQSFPKDTR